MNDHLIQKITEKQRKFAEDCCYCEVRQCKLYLPTERCGTAECCFFCKKRKDCENICFRYGGRL